LRDEQRLGADRDRPQDLAGEPGELFVMEKG
jgi:hypothetical protein